MPTPFANDRLTNALVVGVAFAACAAIISWACYWLANVAQEVWRTWPWR